MPSFFKLFYTISQILAKDIPQGLSQENCRSHRQFLRLVPETLSRFSCWISIENFMFCLTMPDLLTTRWHIWHTRDTVWTSRTNLHGKHLSETWNYACTHSQQMFFFLFSGAWGSFNLKRKSSRTVKILHAFLGFFKCRQRIRIGNSLVRSE